MVGELSTVFFRMGEKAGGMIRFPAGNGVTIFLNTLKLKAIVLFF
jgi:hypothetical protein